MYQDPLPAHPWQMGVETYSKHPSLHAQLSILLDRERLESTPGGEPTVAKRGSGGCRSVAGATAVRRAANRRAVRPTLTAPELGARCGNRWV